MPAPVPAVSASVRGITSIVASSVDWTSPPLPDVVDVALGVEVIDGDSLAPALAPELAPADPLAMGDSLVIGVAAAVAAGVETAPPVPSPGATWLKCRVISAIVG
jgi:hypothetical protein